MLAGQDFRNGIAGDFLRQTFDDRRFADPGLPDQNRVVFGPAAENLNNPFDFLFAADHRVQFAVLRHFRQVAAERF